MSAPYIISAVALLVVICGIGFIYYQQDKVRKDFRTKMQNIVDQINDSSYYQYNYDKQQQENIKHNDQNITNLHDSVVNMQNNVKLLEKTTIRDKSLNERLITAEANVGKLQLGSKFSLSGVGDGISDDNWLRLLNKNGSDYYGGFATANLWTRSLAEFNGTTNINGVLNIKDTTTIKGGVSEMNQANLDTVFASEGERKNFIRGDTELLGHLNHKGNMITNRAKVGHSFGDFTDISSLSVWKNNGKIGAAFGGPTLWSFFTDQNNDVLIRPGKEGRYIKIGDDGNPIVQLTDSWFPNENGDTMINSKIGKKILIGSPNDTARIEAGASKINLNGDVNIAKKLYFKDDTMTSGSKSNNNGDDYNIEKITNGMDNSELRVTINNEPDDSLTIYGCNTTTGCTTGSKAHQFRADGSVFHNGQLCLGSTCVTENHLKKVLALP